jgi:hypothetical protein
MDLPTSVSLWTSHGTWKTAIDASVIPGDQRSYQRVTQAAETSSAEVAFADERERPNVARYLERDDGLLRDARLEVVHR